METPTELITVYRSADASAEVEAEAICDTLVEAGLTAVVLDDSDPGVLEGSWEVRVLSDQVDQANQIIAEFSAPAGDPSEEMDLIPLFEDGTDLSELEAMNLKALLEAAEIPAVVFGNSALPNLPFEVRVPQELLEVAEQVIAEAASAPASDAEEPSQAG